ncbi:transcriptional regulator [Nocardia cyriacigeorgica]|nr:transcriptional regulator [Nocardia cyriacigeorgica]MBF6286597.1 transcriptional regulator [Nocardia cyriacigeorgica]MBF6424955.1 transcriptional regulator [Nocardia cyriacigeorgica]
MPVLRALRKPSLQANEVLRHTTATEPLRWAHRIERAMGGWIVIVAEWTGVEVRAMRTAALRITQQAMAELLGFTEAVVRKWEKRGATITLGQQYAEAMDTLLRRLDDEQRGRFAAALHGTPAPTSRSEASGEGLFEPVATIVERTQRLAELDADDHLADTLDLAMMDLLDRYETQGPQRLAPEAVALRQRVDAALHRRRHPHHLQRLNALAARLSGVLGYMAVNRGRFGLAKLYCREAYIIAAHIDDRELLAWIKGTESFCAYYMGDFRSSASLACEGIELAGAGPQAIRLYSNGLARALGKLGDVKGVDRAVEKAAALAETHGTGPRLTPALTFAPYGHARMMANAATAYLSAGQYGKTFAYGHQIEEYIDESDSTWSRSLVGLDVATALSRKADPDLEQAVHLGIKALSATSDRPIRSVWQRAHELGAAFRSTPAALSDEYLDYLREWSAAARGISAAEVPNQSG